MVQLAPSSILLAACLAVFGCGEEQPPAVAPEAESVTEPTTIDDLPFPPDDAPSIEEPSYEPSYGEPVEREALYVVSPVAGGKGLQAASLHFDDGESWVRSYRPVAEELQYADKRVVVTGRPFTNSPYVQSVSGTHFELASIRLADGETPYDPLPTRIPTPPFVESLEALQGRVGLWAHCAGILEELDTSTYEHPWWASATVRLAGGDLLRADPLRWGDHPPELATGEVVTVLGWVDAGEGDAAPTLGGPARICKGKVERCLVDDAWQEDGAKK